MFERVAPEQHDTLPDIPEPAENPILLGHEAACAMLARAYCTARLSHALLFTGPRGIGKATLAFHLAHHLFMHPDQRRAPEEFSPINAASQSFRLVSQGAHRGILHLTRPYVERDKKFKTVITVDEIRRVNRFLSLTPPDGGYRIILVDPADDMNVNAANALLKSLEEPPPNTLFVLIAHSPGQLLPTIRSRCQTINLEPLSPNLLLEVLSRIGANLPQAPEDRQLLVEQAGGSVREAVLLTQFGGLEIAQAVDRICSSPRFDVVQAQKLAEAASGRDRQVQFDLFNRMILDRLAKLARQAAVLGETAKAASFASSWQEVDSTIREVELFNLDRRQHVMGLLERLHGGRH